MVQKYWWFMTVVGILMILNLLISNADSIFFKKRITWTDKRSHVRVRLYHVLVEVIMPCTVNMVNENCNCLYGATSLKYIFNQWFLTVASSSTKVRVRGSKTFVWFTDKCLGQGATGKVYEARHRVSLSSAGWIVSLLSWTVAASHK